MYLYICLYTVSLSLIFDDVPLPGESSRRRIRSLLLCLCDVFQALINSLVCWFCTSALGLVLFQTCDNLSTLKQPKQNIPMAALMLPLLTEIAIGGKKQNKQKTDTCTGPYHPTHYHWGPQTIHAVWIQASRHVHHNQHRRQREGQENLEWERVIGSLSHLL